MENTTEYRESIQNLRILIPKLEIYEILCITSCEPHVLKQLTDVKALGKSEVLEINYVWEKKTKKTRKKKTRKEKMIKNSYPP